MSLAIVDLGCGNLGSVAVAMERFGLAPVITDDPQRIADSDRVILPGVGAAGFAMERMQALGLHGPLRTLRQPLLGICLGMQLLFEYSEEDGVEGLGLLSGRVRRLDSAPGRPVPHMGWSRLTVRDPQIGLTNGDYVYFAHSFACDEGETTRASADYGRSIPAVVTSGSIWGAQFHPEKSGPAGARFLQSWLSS